MANGEDTRHHPNRKVMRTPQEYMDRYPRILHALDMPDDRAINLLRRHQEGISTPNEQQMLASAVSPAMRDMRNFRRPRESYYVTGQNRPFPGSPDRAYEDY